MGVVARFFVQSVTQYANQPDGREVKLAPVTRGDANHEWSKWTPAGEIRMTILSPSAASQFEVGKEFTVRFEPAE